MAFPESTLRRLSFVRYLYQVAVEQSRVAEPFGAAALLGFHDAIEFFLQVASERHNVGSARPDFMQYFGFLDAAISPDQVSQKEAMRRLNKARVALKHHGTFPSKLDVDDFRALTTQFFQENTPRLFSVGFDEIALSALLGDTSARMHLERCEAALADGKPEDAVYQAAISFMYLRRAHGLSPYRQNRLERDARDFERELGHRESSVLTDMAEAIHNLQEEVSLLRKGLDPLRLAMFERLAGSASLMGSGEHYVSRMGRGRDTTPAEARFCYEFVISCALKMQEAESLSREFDLPLALVEMRL